MSSSCCEAGRISRFSRQVLLSGHKSADADIPSESPHDVAWCLEVEDNYRDVVLLAQRDSCLIHDPQILQGHVPEGQALVQLCVRVLLRILIIYPVHLHTF